MAPTGAGRRSRRRERLRFASGRNRSGHNDKGFEWAGTSVLGAAAATIEIRRHRNPAWLGKSSARRQRGGRGCASACSESSERTMIPIPSGVRVWIATGHTDMRRGMQGLALQVQEQLKRDPHAGDLYIFRGRRGDLAKILWHDGVGLSLYAKRLDRGRFIWPSASGGRGVDLDCPDGLYAGRHRLAESSAHVEAEERGLSEEKHGFTRILGRHKSRDL